MADGARRISPLRTQARVGDPLREASRRPSRNHRVATFPCLLGVAVLQVGLEESLPAQGKHLVAVLLLKQPDRGRSAIYLARDRLHVCVSRRPPLPGAPRILRCHEEGGGERSDGQLKTFSPRQRRLVRRRVRRRPGRERANLGLTLQGATMVGGNLVKVSCYDNQWGSPAR